MINSHKVTKHACTSSWLPPAHSIHHIPSSYNNEQTTKETKAINNSYIYISHVNVTQTVPDISPLMPMHQDPLLVLYIHPTPTKLSCHVHVLVITLLESRWEPGYRRPEMNINHAKIYTTMLDQDDFVQRIIWHATEIMLAQCYFIWFQWQPICIVIDIYAYFVFCVCHFIMMTSSNGKFSALPVLAIYNGQSHQTGNVPLTFPEGYNQVSR